MVSPLPGLAADGRGEARSVNDAGVIAGASALASGESQAVMWVDGQVRNLGTLGGTTSDAFAVNDRGDVVGVAQDTTGTNRAFLYRDGEMHDISAGLGAQSSKAVAINDAGVAVGELTDRVGRSFAFVWTDETGAVDLNTYLPAGSGWVLTRANDVNELGQIVGFGTHDGRPRAFLLSTAHAPFAVDQSATTEAGHPVSIRLDGWDPDVIAPLTASIVEGPAHGNLSALDGDTVTYTPTTDVRGEDSFTFRLNDGQFDSALARVTITITGGIPTSPSTPPTDDTTTTATPTRPGTDTTEPGNQSDPPPPTADSSSPNDVPPSVAVDEPTVAVPTTGTPTPPGAPAAGLPTTGADISRMLLVAVVAIGAGVVLAAMRRTRRRAP